MGNRGNLIPGVLSSHMADFDNDVATHHFDDDVAIHQIHVSPLCLFSLVAVLGCTTFCHERQNQLMGTHFEVITSTSDAQLSRGACKARPRG